MSTDSEDLVLYDAVMGGGYEANRERIRPEIFSDPSNKSLASAIVSIYGAGNDVNYTTASAIAERELTLVLERINPLLGRLGQHDQEEVRNALSLLEDRLAKTKISSLAMSVVSMCRDGVSKPDTIVSAFKVGVSAIYESLPGSGNLSEPDSAYEFIDSELPEKSIPTGIIALDSWMAGGYSTGLTLICGRPSHGKTSFSLFSALRAATSGLTVGFFSLEMSEKEVRTRILSMYSGVEFGKIYTRKLDGYERSQISGAVKNLARIRILVDDRSFVGVDDISNTVRRHPEIDIVFVDHIGYMRSNGPRTMSPEQQSLSLGGVAKGLKAVAKERSIPIVTLVQLNRLIEGRSNPAPRLSDLRESGHLEQDSDVVIGISQPSKFNPSTKPGMVEIHLLKNRNGAIGVIDAIWNGPTMTFDEVSNE